MVVVETLVTLTALVYLLLLDLVEVVVDQVVVQTTPIMLVEVKDWSLFATLPIDD